MHLTPYALDAIYCIDLESSVPGADGGVWRIAFAFDPERAAILLVGGDKSGVGSGRFYKGLIKRADTRFDQHLEALT
jgi:hypothetical protein